MSMYSYANDLYTGKKSYNFIGKRKIWFSVAALAVLVSIVLAHKVCGCVGSMASESTSSALSVEPG